MSRSTSFAGVINSIAYKLNILLFSSPSAKTFKTNRKKKKLALRESLDVKVLELETLAYKDKLSEDEYFPLTVELPGLHKFIKELKQIANSMHTGFANLSFFNLQCQAVLD